jgi:hypothetical protein
MSLKVKRNDILKRSKYFLFKLVIILVFGVDLRSNVIGIGWERLAEIKNENRNLKVRFEIGTKIKQNSEEKKF